MSPAWIRPRVVKKTTRNQRGRSYQVLYRRGGRDYPIESAGSFKTEREAKLRRDLVAGWLAVGLNPREELIALAAAPPRVRTLTETSDAFMASRVDLAPATAVITKYALSVLTKQFGDRAPATVTIADLQELVSAQTTKPATVRRYVEKWRMLFDFANVTPNPARSKHLRLPRVIREEANPPTWEHLVAAIAQMPRHYHLPMILLEQTGMRVGEAETLTWGDVDEQGNQLRLRAAATKTRRARWVQVPEWLMPHISATCPVEDRVADRRVFPRFVQASARQSLAHACPRAGVPYFSPHDLRHRRATIWHHSGLPLRVQMERGGWTTAEMPLEVYSHLMPLAEAPVSALEAVLVRTP